jgi:ribose-phosphate pyrophosphokinase
MSLSVVAGSANPDLGEAVARELQTKLAATTIDRFPDGECHVTLEAGIRGHDVYLVQPTGPHVDEHLMELLLLADAARRGGAARVTAVVPYFAYARQDRRTEAAESIGARVVADSLAAAGIDRVVVVDPHTAALEAMFAVPVDCLSGVPVLAAALQPLAPANAVVVAPDLGAVKLAERYAAALDLPVVVVRKTRLSATSVRADELVGAVEGRVPIVVDDMISTGGTLCAAIDSLLRQGCQPSLLVAATHGLLVEPAVERLRDLPIERLIVTDTLPPHTEPAFSCEIASVAGLLADAIGRLHMSSGPARRQPADPDYAA